MVGFVISSFVYIVAVQRHFLGYSSGYFGFRVVARKFCKRQHRQKMRDFIKFW